MQDDADDHHQHDFWGFSPMVDMLAASRASRKTGGRADAAASDLAAQAGGEGEGEGGAAVRCSPSSSLSVLQIAPADARHTLATLASWAARERRRSGAVAAATPTPKKPTLLLAVLEPHPEGLARHLLLLHTLLDPELPLGERARLLPELHGNAALTSGGGAYLARAASALEEAVHRHPYSQGMGGDDDKDQGVIDAVSSKSRVASPVARLLDLRGLRHRDRDALARVFSRWRRRQWQRRAKSGGNEPPLIQQQWELRLRRRLGSRYDSRVAVADCDYHLRARDRSRFVVDAAAAPSSPSPAAPPAAAASLLCREHFVHWRLTGVAHELRGRGDYAEPNLSLLSAAQGRLLPRGGVSVALASAASSPFAGKEAGPSVVATGYWGDVSTGPFVALGGAPLWSLVGGEDDDDEEDEAKHAAAAAAMAEAALAGEGPGLLARRSTVDAAELNVLMLLRRLYGGDVVDLQRPETAHLAIKARGPTTEEDLAAAADEAAAAAGAATVAAAKEKEEQEPEAANAEQSKREAELWTHGLSNVRLALGLLGSADEVRGFAAATLARQPQTAPKASFDVVSLGARQTTAALLQAAAETTDLLLLVEDAAGSVTLSDATAAGYCERVRGAVVAGAAQGALVEAASEEKGRAAWPLIAPGQLAFVKKGRR